VPADEIRFLSQETDIFVAVIGQSRAPHCASVESWTMPWCD
jgi:hypothetical protein